MFASRVVPEDAEIGFALSRESCTQLVSCFVFDRVTIRLPRFGVARIKPRATGPLDRLVERPGEGLLEFSFPVRVRVHDHRLNLPCDGLQVLEPLLVKSLEPPSRRRTSQNQPPDNYRDHHN